MSENNSLFSCFLILGFVDLHNKQKQQGNGRLDQQSNYDVKKEKFYYSLPTCIINQSGTVDQFVDMQVKNAERHYENSIIKLAERIEKKGLNISKLTLSTSYLDPNISTKITDGEKTINAYTIIASGVIQKPHYRYLIK